MIYWAVYSPAVVYRTGLGGPFHGIVLRLIRQLYPPVSAIHLHMGSKRGE